MILNYLPRRFRNAIILTSLTSMLTLYCDRERPSPLEPTPPEPPQGEVQNGTSDSNGRFSFSNINTQVMNIYSRQPIQGANSVYYNVNQGETLATGTSDRAYFPKMNFPFSSGYTLHDPDYIIELTPFGTPDYTLNYVVEKVTGESLDTFHNFFDFVMTNANCQSGTNITYNGTVTGEEFYSYNHLLGGLVIRVFDTMTGIPFSDIVGTIEGVGVSMRDPTTGVDLRSTNWDKYIRTDPPSITPLHIYIPSNAPRINLYPPEVRSENSVTLTMSASDSWTYPQPYTNIEDATIKCKGPTQGNDLSFFFRIINSSNYENWRSCQNEVTVTGLSPGNYEAQAKVIDDTGINEDISDPIPFTISSGGGGLEILAQFDFDVAQHGNILGIAWDNPSPLLGGSHKRVYITYPEYDPDNLILIDDPEVPHFIEGLDQNPWSNRLWSCYEDKIYEHETNISSIRNTFNSPENMAFTNDLAWITSSSLFVCGTGSSQYELYLVNPNNNMSIIKRENSPNNEQPVGSAYDGDYIWIVTYQGNIYPLDPTTLRQVGSQKYDAPSNYPSDLAPGVSSLWYSDQLAEIYEIRITP